MTAWRCWLLSYTGVASTKSGKENVQNLEISDGPRMIVEMEFCVKNMGCVWCPCDVWWVVPFNKLTIVNPPESKLPFCGQQLVHLPKLYMPQLQRNTRKVSQKPHDALKASTERQRSPAKGVKRNPWHLSRKKQAMAISQSMNDIVNQRQPTRNN